MSVSQDQVESAIKQFIDPYLEKDLVTAGSIKNIDIDGDSVKVKVVLGYPAYGYMDKLSAELKSQIEAPGRGRRGRGGRQLGSCQPYRAGWHEPTRRHQKRDCGGLR